MPYFVARKAIEGSRSGAGKSLTSAKVKEFILSSYGAGLCRRFKCSFCRVDLVAEPAWPEEAPPC